ncbi:hypothetical protein Acr_21g0001450 [Actinidia rufa]|uniref:Acyl-CoA N-acyltransferases (NAT) superfamily protein n=1 Tax=Actinidia rufa TaxID=165716 RepID=A0A7J0GFH8_9ERIC|nr:hypothetical protein Acr_21g0001450 [Actinidia rufa]
MLVIFAIEFCSNLCKSLLFQETGWIPCHIIAEDEDKNVLGVVPLYLKSHSNGEYVFDHSWADAYYSYGSRYYPKLQCCVPFTPVTGQRILLRDTPYKDQVFDMLVSTMKDLTAKVFDDYTVYCQSFAAKLSKCIIRWCVSCGETTTVLLDPLSCLRSVDHQDRPRQCRAHFVGHNMVCQPRLLLYSAWLLGGVFALENESCAVELRGHVCSGHHVHGGVSSVHVTFPIESEWHRMKEKGFLQRIGMQYHWKNRNYKNFDEFLLDMKQNKRKNIRQERKKISAQNLLMKRLRGHEIKAKHWDTFYKFYRNTTDNKWGGAYLTRDFFHEMGSKLGDNVLLIVAEEGDELVAGALNLIGGDTLFGRLWGCLPQAYYPSLHFEACYYQAIEAAIELNLDKVEAGAQGEHKVQRGYMPVPTYSCHYIADEGYRKVIEDFLVREAAQVKLVMKLIHDSGPFKEGFQ